MRAVAVGLIVLLAAGCNRAPEPAKAAPPAALQTPAVAQPAAVQAPAASITASGRRLITADGKTLEWRGITAFRLLEMLSAAREREVVDYLDWAVSQRLTVIRVLVMAQHLFKLTPEHGRTALPQLLELAKARGLYVEAVALADTRGVPVDIDAHVRDVGRIALEHGNAFVEIANEPGHPTQDARLHDPAFVAKLATLIPDRVLVALGSVEYGDGYAAGDYVTFHSSRGTREWDHVTAIADGARLIERFNKPVISDEPIGAAAEYVAGRRDNEPARFAAAGALSRLTGVGATFHYEDGLQSRIPSGRQAACLAAWLTGLMLAGDDGDESGGAFLSEPASVASVSGARAAYARVSPQRARLLVIDPSPSTRVEWQAPWVEASRAAVPGVLLITATR